MRRPISKGAWTLAALVLVAGAVKVLGVIDVDSIAPAQAQGPPATYVDAGSIGGACSDGYSAAQAHAQTTPLCTIAAGIRSAGSGGTVLVRGGTYPPLTVADSGRAATVTVAAYQSETVTLPSIVIDAGAGFVRFEGLRLTGSTSNETVAIDDAAHDVQVVGSDIASQGQDAIALRPGVKNVLIESNHITSRAAGANDGGTSITLNSTSTLPGSPSGQTADAPISNVKIINNRLDQTGVDGIRPANFVDLTIAGNEITGISENGEHTDAIQTVFGGRNLTIEGNYIHDNRGEGILIKDGEVTNARIANNVFTHNALEYQLQVFDTIGLTIVNNTFWDNELSVVLRDGVRDGVIANNIFDNLGAVDASVVLPYVKEDYNVIAGGYGWTPQGSHDIRGRPTFVDAAHGDYRLAAASLGIDAADASVAPAADKACRPRFDAPSKPNRGGGSPPYVDIGALEYGPTSQAGDVAAPFDEGCAGTPVAPPPSRTPLAKPPSGCAGLTVLRVRRTPAGLRLSIRARRAGKIRVRARLRWPSSYHGRTSAKLPSVRVGVDAAATVHPLLRLSGAQRRLVGSLGSRVRVRVTLIGSTASARTCTKSITIRLS